MRAISSFRREVGISTWSCIALFALRMRVSMSATGSVSIGSPARFRHPGDHAVVRELAQADPAEAELAVHGARPAAAVAAPVEARRREAAEVADARQRDRHEAVEELVHTGAAERDLRADRHPFADL